MRRIDMTGQRYARLVALRSAGNGEWLFRCDCGTEKVTNSKNVRRGLVRSCGCLRKETSRAVGLRTRTHGHAVADTPEYRAWHHAKDRCHNENNQCYGNYGGRGIRVCAEWRNDFVAFLRHIGPRPDGHSLDRIDNDKGYEPGNVRWATGEEQARNRRTNHIVAFKGRTVTLAEAIEESGLSGKMVRERIRLGWPVERALA